MGGARLAARYGGHCGYDSRLRNSRNKDRLRLG